MNVPIPSREKEDTLAVLGYFKFYIFIIIYSILTHIKYIDRVSLISLTSDTSLKSPWHPSCFLHPAASTTLRLRRSRVRFLPPGGTLPTPRGPYVTPAMPQWREFPKRWSKRKRFWRHPMSRAVLRQFVCFKSFRCRGFYERHNPWWFRRFLFQRRIKMMYNFNQLEKSYRKPTTVPVLLGTCFFLLVLETYKCLDF